MCCTVRFHTNLLDVPVQEIQGTLLLFGLFISDVKRSTVVTGKVSAHSAWSIGPFQLTNRKGEKMFFNLYTATDTSTIVAVIFFIPYSFFLLLFFNHSTSFIYWPNVTHCKRLSTFSCLTIQMLLTACRSNPSVNAWCLTQLTCGPWWKMLK